MEVVAVILGIYSIFSTLGFAILYTYNMDLSIEVKYRREENGELKAEIEQYKEALDRKKYWRDKEKWILIEAEQNGVFDDDDYDDDDEFWDDITK